METTIKQIEDMSLNAWPSHKMELYDGWILRFSYFYTHRTNSVEQFGNSTLTWREKIPYCESVYKRLGTPAVFKISPLVSPDFDYVLETDAKGEIGDLYRNYEDMRLRLKESTEENIQHEKQNKELVSNISHDLKTPITAIKGYVEGIMDGVADTPEKMEKYIGTIYNKANEMDTLINELTLYAKIDTNRIPYNFAPLSVNDYFNDCAEDIEMELDSKNVEFGYFNYVEGDQKIIADPEQLKRVINNIVSNSLKYMEREHGLINLRVKDVGDFIQVELEDNGKGIAAKDLPNIFDRFYRTDASRNSSKGGSGIGLSIVKKILEDHGGKVWATSRLGIGTIMYFVLRKYQEVPMK